MTASVAPSPAASPDVSPDASANTSSNATCADAVFPPLASAPTPTGGWAWLQPYVRPAFIRLNRWFMIPVHRAGLGAWLATPVMGYMLLLRVRGRKSGLVREIPLSYLVAEGSAWVLAGFGETTEWYRNLLVDPHVEVVLPGRQLAAIADVVPDPAARARIMPPLVRATAGDEAILAVLDWIPLVRLTPESGPIEPGADDPGGRAWIWRQGLLLGLWLLARRLLRRG